MTIADATPLNKIELLLKTVPSRSPSNHKNRDDTHASHKQDKHTTHHRFYTGFFNNGGHPKRQIRDDERFILLNEVGSENL